MSVLNCGGSFIAFWEKSDPQSSFWKTSQLSFLQASQELSSASFPKSGMTVNGRLYQHNRWEPRTLGGAGSASVIYPTATASDYGSGGDPKDWANGVSGKRRPSLQTMARKHTWPTPTVCGNYNKAGLSKSSGRLNPTWVELLMGFPAGYTEM